MVTNDPVARYTAGAVLVLAFVGCLAIAVHGYWQSPNYQLPAFIASVLSAGIGGALTLLGVHLGTSGTTQGVNQGAQVVTDAKAGNGAHA